MSEVCDQGLEIGNGKGKRSALRGIGDKEEAKVRRCSDDRNAEGRAIYSETARRWRNTAYSSAGSSSSIF